MVRLLLVRGMLVGLLAGLLMFGVARVFGEPQVDRAISVENALNEAKAQANAARGIHDAPEIELVSRRVQAGLGLFTGVMVYSIAFGGLFGLVFAAVNGRVGRLGPRAIAALLAATGFVAVSLTPGLIYPANPPSIGHPDTIGQRTILYATVLAVSIGAMAAAGLLRHRLAVRLGPWNAALLGATFYAAAIILVAMILPRVNEVPAVFPAVTLWHFRVVSLGMQLLLWITLGLVFGALTERSSQAIRDRLAWR